MNATVQPIQQPPVEDLRNALQIADNEAALLGEVDYQSREAFASVARLIRDALGKLGEPNAAALEVARQAMGGSYVTRFHRDTTAAILHAALNGPPLEPR